MNTNRSFSAGLPEESNRHIIIINSQEQTQSLVQTNRT